MKSPEPIRRRAVFYLRRRVPKRYHGVEDRREILTSLHTDSEKDARTRAAETWAEMVRGWEALLAGDIAAADDRMAAAREIARTHGFQYRTALEISRRPLDEIVARVKAATNPKDGTLDHRRAPALLGTVEKPHITLAGAWDIFWKHTEQNRHGMTVTQERIWRTTRMRSMRRLNEAAGGDIPISEFGTDEALDVREMYWEMVLAGQVTRATANKEMGHAFHVLRTVNKIRRLNLPLAFDGLRFDITEKATRPPFSDTWIKERLLAPGALGGLNTEARCVLLGMIHTGYRPSEAVGLRPEDIRLDTDIPHIDINSTHRHLKTSSSARVLPLVGVSLEAFQACPGGFPRYLDGATIGATINKYLTEHLLRETPGHSLYCLRHSFEDRLLHAGVDERIRRDLMGHRLANRERYGAGARLDHLHSLLQDAETEFQRPN